MENGGDGKNEKYFFSSFFERLLASIPFLPAVWVRARGLKSEKAGNIRLPSVPYVETPQASSQLWLADPHGNGNGTVAAAAANECVCAFVGE